MPRLEPRLKSVGMNIHQMSVRYLEEQDRILIRINTRSDEEVRLWFTRRFLLGFWPLLSQAVAEHTASLSGAETAAAGAEAKKMLAEFKQAEVVQNTDMKTPFKGQPARFPFGAEPLLVTSAQVGWEPRGKLRLSFEEKLHPEHTPRSFQLGLGEKLTHGLMHLLDRETVRAGWRSADMPVPAAGEKAANEDAGGDRPKYLN